MIIKGLRFHDNQYIGRAEPMPAATVDHNRPPLIHVNFPARDAAAAAHGHEIADAAIALQAKANARKARLAALWGRA